MSCHGIARVMPSLSSLNVLLLLNPDTTFIRTYDGKKRKTINFELQIQKDVLRNCMPVLEPIPCAILGGIVFCQFFNNHIEDLEDEALDPGIVQFLSESKGSESAVVITAFRLPSSIVQQGYALKKLSILKKVNGKVVKTIAEFRTQMRKEVERYLSDAKKRYVPLEIGGSMNETIYVDLELLMRLEPMLYCTPGYSREHSILQVEQSSRKRSISDI